MGYVEDLRDKCLEEFKPQLEEAKEKNPDDFLFQMDFSVVSFSYGFIEGWKTIHELNRLIKAIRKTKRQITVRINEHCASLNLGTEQWNALSDKEKRDFKKNIKHALLGITDELSERIKKLKKIKCDILLRIGNVFLYILSALLSFGFGSLLYLDNIVINAIIYPISVLALIGFIAIQVLYTIKYLKAIKATIRGIIDFSIKRAFSTLLMVWWYIFLLAVVNQWNTNIVTYSFIAVFALNVVFLIFDMFLSSQLFDEEESIFSLIAAIIIGIFYFTDSINNTIVKQIGTSILLVACFLLHILIIKKFILDKKPIKDILGIMDVVGIIATTIILTILALYKLLWQAPVDGQTVDNTLFSAVVGLYAAILGGGLTLAGVAWTIKHNQKIRQEDRKNEVKPFFGLLNNLDVRVIKANEHVYHFFTCNNDSEKAIVGNFVNTDKNCFILKKIIVAEKEYTPDSQYLVSKEEIFQIRIFEDEIPDDDCKIILIVEDQNGNEWLYNLVKSGTYIISMKTQQGENQ